MTHQFSRVPRANIQRSSFDRSHGCKTSFDSGWLIPIFVDEALPGDTFNVKLSALARLATPIHPLMDNMFMETFFFAVPYRLVWDNWEKFNGAQDNPGDSTDYLVPQISFSAIGENSLNDYFGLPTGNLNGGVKVNSLHHRAYNLIWNEWFRDQNLQNSLPVPTDDGPDTAGDFTLQRRNKRHDYFTSCLPWPQKGDPVEVPLLGDAPVLGIGTLTAGTFGSTNTPVKESDGTQSTYVNSFTAGVSPENNLILEEMPNSDNFPNIRADLTAATGASVNAVRQAFQVQKMLERDARSGTRYTETLRAHFGVVSPDFRLQRPEYLGGGLSPINITPVPQTQRSDVDESPQGNLAGYGTAVLNRHGFTKSFTEHCLLIGLVNVRADLTYQQGLNRMWSRQTRYDFYWPSLSHLGEQAVLAKEIFANGTAPDEDVFGYQERFAE